MERWLYWRILVRTNVHHYRIVLHHNNIRMIIIITVYVTIIITIGVRIIGVTIIFHSPFFVQTSIFFFSRSKPVTSPSATIKPCSIIIMLLLLLLFLFMMVMMMIKLEMMLTMNKMIYDMATVTFLQKLTRLCF